MVVGQHDSGFAHAADLWPSSVMRAKIVVPAPGADSTSSVPPISDKPLAHAVEPEAAVIAGFGGLRADIEAAAVVLDDHLQRCVRPPYDDAHIGRPSGVLDDVGKPFLHDAVYRSGDFIRHLIEVRIVAMKIDLGAALLAPFGDVARKRLAQAEFVDRGRPQFPGDPVQRLAHLLHSLAHEMQAFARRAGGQGIDLVEFENGGDQALSGLIVQLVRQAQPFIFLGHRQMPAQARSPGAIYFRCPPPIARWRAIDRPTDGRVRSAMRRSASDQNEVMARNICSVKMRVR